MNTLVRLSAVFLAASCLHAGDEPVIDPDLPQPLDLSFADALVSQSPFTRSVNLEESLQLTGVVYVDGRPYATVMNKATKESIVVSEELNAQGWRLTGALASTDLSNTEVHMMVGPESITMHYHTSQPGAGAGPGERGSAKSRLAGSEGKGDKGDNKFRASNFLGDKGRELYASLSPEARDKFKDLVKSHLDKQPGQTPEQTSAYAQKVFAKIKSTDQSSGAAAKSPKMQKPNKKKQGA